MSLAITEVQKNVGPARSDRQVIAYLAFTGILLALGIDIALPGGDQMARVMSMVMAIFMIGPILAPLLGEVILTFASWR